MDANPWAYLQGLLGIGAPGWFTPWFPAEGGGESLRLSMNKHGMACSHSVVGNLSLERGGG